MDSVSATTAVPGSDVPLADMAQVVPAAGPAAGPEVTGTEAGVAPPSPQLMPVAATSAPLVEGAPRQTRLGSVAGLLTLGPAAAGLADDSPRQSAAQPASVAVPAPAPGLPPPAPTSAPLAPLPPVATALRRAPSEKVLLDEDSTEYDNSEAVKYGLSFMADVIAGLPSELAHEATHGVDLASKAVEKVRLASEKATTALVEEAVEVMSSCGLLRPGHGTPKKGDSQPQ